MTTDHSGAEITPGDSPRSYRFYLLAAIVAFVVGGFFRFWDIGGAPLAVDEYFFGTSILNIMERGIPEFACGGLYTRGLLLQYMTVPLLSLGISLEFAVRFWPAVASLLSIVAVWRLARLAGGVRSAAVAVVLISLSVWEIEFARFGRMYSPFQAVFLWYLYLQILHLIRGSNAARWWYLALSAVSIFVYAGASFLLVLNFIPLVWCGKRWNIPHLTTSVALLTGGVFYYSRDFRYLGLDPAAAPPTIESESLASLPVNIPHLPGFLAPILVTGFLFSCYLLWRYRSVLRVAHPSIIYWSLVAVCACFGLFGLSIGLLLAGLLMQLPLPVSGNRVKIAPVVRAVLVAFVVWIGVLSVLFSLGGSDAWATAKSSLMYTVNFPDVYYHVVRPWFRTIPVTSALLIILLAFQYWILLVAQRERQSEELHVQRFLSAALILLAMLAAFFKQPYEITRYTYFLYPTMLVLASTSVVFHLSSLFRNRHVAAAAIIAPVSMFFVFAEDYRLGHLLNINEPEVRYRSIYNDRLAAHYYVRWDYRSAAYFVNERLSDNDSVIVFDQPLPHYLDRTSGIFVRAGTENHSLVWACGGERDLWSNATLLDAEREVRRLISETPGDVWLIMRSDAYRSRDPFEEAIRNQYELELEHLTHDGRLVVYRLPNR